MTDQKIVADITKRILLGESLEDIWFDKIADIDYLEVLLDKFNIDVNIQNVYGNSALYWASYANNLDFVKLLLEHGADPNIKDVNGDTALIWAHGKKMKALLKQYGAR